MSKYHEIHEMFEMIFRQARMQFGDAMKSKWIYDGGDCPGCRKELSTMKYKKQQALSLNSFIYRDYGVVIAYLLCGKCAHFIFRDEEKNPGSMKETLLHGRIEATLKVAYAKGLGH